VDPAYAQTRNCPQADSGITADISRMGRKRRRALGFASYLIGKMVDAGGFDHKKLIDRVFGSSGLGKLLHALSCNLGCPIPPWDPSGRSSFFWVSEQERIAL